MKILVTGGTCYMGSVPNPLLLSDGHQVTSFDTHGSGIPSLT